MIYLSALDELSEYDQAQYEAWYSYYLLVHQRDYSAALDAALMGYKLQPNNVLVNMNLAYACLYCGYYEDADDDQDLKEVQDDGSPEPEVKETKKSGKKKNKK